MKAAYCLISVVFLVGCAAQDSHRQYFSAQNQYEAALAKDPKNPDLTKAKERIEAGRAALKQGRYDIAAKEFRESNNLSEPIVDPEGYKKKLAAKGILIPPPPMPVTPKAAEVTTASPTPTPKPSHQNDDSKPRSLPAQALAKYLAGKSQSPTAATKSAHPAEGSLKIPEKKKLEDHVETKATVKEAEAKVANREPVKDAKRVKLSGKQVAGKKPIAQKGPDPDEVEAPPMKAADDDEKELRSEETKQPVMNADKVTITRDQGEKVAAPAKPTDKFVAPDKPSVAMPSIVPQVEKPKTKIPGALRFSSNQSSLEPDSMLNLDQTSKFLLENPSTSVVFQGILGPGEANTIVDSRFESLRSYLVGKGVPDDQVRLDQKRRSGARPEFEMYIVEH